MTDASEFPTDRYVLAGLAAQHGRELLLLESDPVEGVRPEDVARACGGKDVALVCLSHVSYRSGALADMRAITEVAHDAGALVLWDLSHSAGAVPVRLDACGVDLAVGCSYKYLNAGPGSPAYLYVRRDLQESLRSPIQGWFGQRDQFAMGPAYEPAQGIERFLAGTPPVLGLLAVASGVELALEAGDEALREKSMALNEAAIELHDSWLAPLGFELGSPRAPERRGGHVSVRHPDAWRICRGLIQRDVVPDFRGPGQHPTRVPAALLEVRRRLGRFRPPPRSRRVRGLPGRRSDAGPRHLITPKCPRQESNLRTRFRKPLLYPLSYGGRIAGFAGTSSASKSGSECSGPVRRWSKPRT